MEVSNTITDKDIIVVFDFDGTLSPFNTFSKFFNRFLLKRPLRLVILIILLPVMLPFLFIKATTEFTINVLLWCCTFGITLELWKEEMDLFSSSFRRNNNNNIFFKESIQQLKLHQQKGHRIFIISGSSEYLIQAICRDAHIYGIDIIGSSMNKYYNGIITGKRCLGIEKVRALKNRFNISSWNYAYTDSLTDLPLLKEATHKIIINAKDSDLKKLNKQFGNQIKQYTWT